MGRSENNLNAVLQDTADAIRSKTKEYSAKYCPRDYADIIRSLVVPYYSAKDITDPNIQFDVSLYNKAYTSVVPVALLRQEYLPDSYEITFNDRYNDTWSIHVKDTCVEVHRLYEYRFEDIGTFELRIILEVDCDLVDGEPKLKVRGSESSIIIYYDSAIASGDAKFAAMLCMAVDKEFGVNFVWNHDNRIRVNHAGWTFEEAVAYMRNKIDLYDVSGRLIYGGLALPPDCYVDGDSSSSQNNASEDYSY